MLDEKKFQPKSLAQETKNRTGKTIPSLGSIVKYYIKSSNNCFVLAASNAAAIQ
jgi:hypothetical protein